MKASHTGSLLLRKTVKMSVSENGITSAKMFVIVMVNIENGVVQLYKGLCFHMVSIWIGVLF